VVNQIRTVEIKFNDQKFVIDATCDSELKWGGRSECVGLLDFIPAHVIPAENKPIILLTGPIVFK